MSTLEATISMLQALPESELLTIYDLTRRFFIKQNKGTEFETMTEEQFLEKLDMARMHADEGKVMDADVAVSKLKMDYKVVVTGNTFEGLYHILYYLLFVL